MSKAIFKYTLEFDKKQQIELPLDAEILSAQMQNEKICLWAKVSNTLTKRKKDVYIYGTGTCIQEDDLSYVGTVQDGIYVWHIFIK